MHNKSIKIKTSIQNNTKWIIICTTVKNLWQFFKSEDRKRAQVNDGWHFQFRVIFSKWTVKISVGIKALHILAVKRRKILLFWTSGYTIRSSEIDFAGCVFFILWIILKLSNLNCKVKFNFFFNLLKKSKCMWIYACILVIRSGPWRIKMFST